MLPFNEPSFISWLCDKRMKVAKAQRRGFDTITALIAWTIWEERNNRVFNQQQKTWVEVAKVMTAEAELWRLANAAMPELPLLTTEWRSQNLVGD
ncbi:Os06g0679900 [Oryza sativa Japonica Group]|uniref:Os06g0679900 protein n=1 Tax=Oryza sativa subsp. japonica TaxID=39947 RepID=A0A0P0X0H8_ORYSJ|nr:Os06g0679900 [Oryza sativa Japonica Group]